MSSFIANSVEIESSRDVHHPVFMQEDVLFLTFYGKLTLEFAKIFAVLLFLFWNTADFCLLVQKSVHGGDITD